MTLLARKLPSSLLFALSAIAVSLFVNALVSDRVDAVWCSPQNAGGPAFVVWESPDCTGLNQPAGQTTYVETYCSVTGGENTVPTVNNVGGWRMYCAEGTINYSPKSVAPAYGNDTLLVAIACKDAPATVSRVDGQRANISCVRASETQVEIRSTRALTPEPPSAGGGAGGVDGEPVDSRPECANGEKGVAVSFRTEGDNDFCVEFDEEANTALEDNPIFVILGRIIQFLLASIGIGLTLVVVIAGYQYMTAKGDPQKTASARKKIGFAITGIIMYALAGTLMNWLIPGGIV